MNKKAISAFQVLLAVGMAVILGFAAKRSFLYADSRVIIAALHEQEPDFQLPLTQAQEEYKKKRDEREMSTAKREQESWRKLGRFLVCAEALPIALLVSVVWFYSAGKDQENKPNKTSESTS